MSYLLVPKRVSNDTAEVWVGVDNEGDDLDATEVLLRSSLGSLSLQGGWSEFGAPGDGHFLRYKTVMLAGLVAGERYELALELGTPRRVVADASVTTLPRRLPTLLARPFTVLLGSCFWVGSDEEGGAGARFCSLAAADQPDIKILCGDQVYLDQPSFDYLTTSHAAAELRRRFLDTYLRTWTQCGPNLGFAQILRRGANFFASDDHEFWNNAPSFATIVRDSHTAAGRARWMREARRLYEIFQSTAAVSFFDVGKLSFCLADTRLGRAEDLSVLMRPGDLQRVQQWVFDLRGPGVLVLGQPLFAEPAGVAGAVVDFSLADYGQYGGLAAMLNAAPHDILVLTGDVHFGRIAECRLYSGVRVVEVISSPLSLVDPLVGGAWSAAPARFPARAIDGVPSADVDTRAFRETRNHFLTLEFGADGHQVQLVVKNWVVGGSAGGASAIVYSTMLH